MEPMQYKGFVWPHNPRTYTIDFTRQTALQKIPMGDYNLQDLGRSCREMRGEGEFFGPMAYDTFKALATVFYEGGPGVLIHPVWQTANAYMVGALGENYPQDDARVVQVQKALIADLYDHRELSDKVSGATRRLVDSMLLQVRLEMRDPHEV